MSKHKNIANPDIMPIINGNRVTFRLESDQQPCLSGDFNNWDLNNGLPLKQTSSRNWEISLEFPPDTYMEYSYMINGSRLLDPKNPNRLNNGTGSLNNYFNMPGWIDSPYAKKKPRKGKLSEHLIVDEFRLANSSRKLYLYQPDTTNPCPLVIVLDGRDYLTRGRITNIVDSLIDAGRIQPLALALIPSTKARFVEYACNDNTTSFINQQVIPLAQTHLNLVDIDKNPGAFCILGASMGGMMALYSAMRFPAVYGKVISQAGAFHMFEEDYSIFEMVEHYPIPPIKVWMGIGRYDFLYQTNQRMRNLLNSKGYNLVYQEVNGGHNFTTWRNDLPQALEYFYPNDK